MSLTYIPIRGVIRCETPVRVGGTRDELQIGGMDNPVVREQRTGEPYLPGSSLKGRLRSLVERDLNLEFSGNQRKDEPHGCAKSDCLFCKVFGPHKKTKHELGPSRLIVRDAFLTAECRAEFQRDPDRLLDVRTENMVNRLSNTATNPRPVERVARGVTFDLEMVVRLQQGDDREEILAMLKRGLELMQQDGVGGGASRGNGKIRIEVTEPAEWAVRN